jgi:hypothetical protein
MRRPKLPASGTIAGWYLYGGPEELDAIAAGDLTAKDARRVAAWVAEWARWVRFKAKRARPQRERGRR